MTKVKKASGVSCNGSVSKELPVQRPHINKRHKNILKAMLEIAEANEITTTAKIAAKANLSPSGTSSSLSALEKKGYVKFLGGSKGKKIWQCI